MKLAVTGDRHYDKRDVVAAALARLKAQGYDVLIEGEAPGADTLAREEGDRLGYDVCKFPAEWKRYGAAAGPIRNRQMLDAGPDLVVYFHDDLSKSKGTANMVGQARKLGITVLDGRYV